MTTPIETALREELTALRSELAEAKAELEHLKIRYENRSLGFDAVARERNEAKAALEKARHSALVDAVAEANRVGGGCEHDQVRIRIVSAIAQLDAAPPGGGKP